MEIVAHIGPDGERYVDRVNAAKLMGVDPDTVSGWVAQGRLAAVGPRRYQLFRLEDVQNAELAAHDGAVRTSGSDVRVKRNLVA